MKNEMYSFSHSFLSWSYCCSNFAWGSSDCDAKYVCIWQICCLMVRWYLQCHLSFLHLCGWSLHNTHLSLLHAHNPVNSTGMFAAWFPFVFPSVSFLYGFGLGLVSTSFPLQRGTEKYHGSEEPSSNPGQYGVAWYREQFPEAALEDVTFSFMISNPQGLQLIAS